MAKLILLQAGESIPHELTSVETTLGRHPECSIVIDSNMVSRKHARVVREGELFYIEDLGSGNGTTLNGQKIAKRELLKNADRLKLGPILFRFESPVVGETMPMPSLAGRGSAGATSAFMLDITNDAGEADTIFSTADNSSRFGSLDVQPAVKLKAVLEISRSLAGTVDLDRLLPKMLDGLFSIFPAADRGCVLLREPGSTQMIPKAIKHRRESDDESVKLSRTIVNRVLQEKTGILSADAANDARFQASESIANFTIRSMMCVPLLSLEGEALGLINIDTQNPLRRFQPDDLDLLMAVAGQAALCYETARLFDTALEKKKQDGEMQIAANVQRALLPSSLPNPAGYEFFASYESAQAVGGDYYDCVQLPDGRFCLAFGDVAGKGVPASLVMSRLSSVVQSTMEFVANAAEATERINRLMCANAVEGRFVTFTLTILDTRTHQFTLVIAGHMSPIIRKADGQTQEFPEDAVGLPLGVMDDFTFEMVNYTLQPGETIVIYTDGVSEAMNHNSDLYGLDRLRNLITAGPASPSELGRKILADVKKHANGRPQNDDITLMAFGRLAK